jgi:hypothetical protein
MKLSKTQSRAIALIEGLGNQWIRGGQLDGINDRTLYALCHTHGILESKREYGAMSYTDYYRIKMVD